MRKLKEVCREIVQELNIIMPDTAEGVIPENRLKLRDIMLEQEWKESGVTCLAARPTMGKSALAMDFVLDAALWMEKPIIWFSHQMREKQLVYRLIKKISGNLGEMQEMDAQKLAPAIAFLENLNIFIDDTLMKSVLEIETKLKDLEEAGMIVIDYIQLMGDNDSVRFQNHNEEVRSIVQIISDISKKRQVPFLILSQMTREVERRENKRPCLEDMHRDIYPEDVNQMIFIYRDEYYRGSDDREQTQDGSAEIILAKSKSGTVKTIPAGFDSVHLCFWKNKVEKECVCDAEVRNREDPQCRMIFY